MRFTFLLALGLSLAIYIGHWYGETANICPVPLSYRLGNIDDRFGITAAEVRPAIAAAESLWEEASGRDLFVYDEGADFAINFIYDERQQLASTEEEWRVSLDAEQKEYEAILAEIKSLGDRYQSAQASYNTVGDEYEERLTAYNAEVERYNQAGGAPKEAYQELQNEADRLRSLERELISQEQTINKLAASLNELGEEGNAKIAAYNAAVEEYNSIFGTSETFTQGDFGRERINIYKFTDLTELTHVIAHEFGHALGIGHVEGEDAVMYYLMTKRDISLSAQDIAALTAVCGESEDIAGSVRRLIRNVLAKV